MFVFSGQLHPKTKKNVRRKKYISESGVVSAGISDHFNGLILLPQESSDLCTHTERLSVNELHKFDAKRQLSHSFGIKLFAVITYERVASYLHN